MSRVGVRTFLVEAYEPRGRGAEALSVLEVRARAAAAELSRSGSRTRYVRTMFLPEDEICLHVFEAPSREAVVEAARLAGLADARITEAVERGSRLTTDLESESRDPDRSRRASRRR